MIGKVQNIGDLGGGVGLFFLLPFKQHPAVDIYNYRPKLTPGDQLPVTAPPGTVMQSAAASPWARVTVSRDFMNLN